MPKFTVTATIGVDVTATVEAADKEDAERMLEGADVTVESCDTDVTFNSCCQINCNIDGVTRDGESLWDSMNKSERMEMLKGNGASDDAAYEIAGRSFEDIPDEWKGYFE